MFRRSRERVVAPHSERLMTKQSHKDECDINRILKQYQRTGIITHVQNARPTYMDLPDAMDFQVSMNIVLEGNEAFSSLPAQVRAHFHNDPAAFLAALSDPDQAQQMREWGFLKPLDEPPAPQPDRPAEPAKD